MKWDDDIRLCDGWFKETICRGCLVGRFAQWASCWRRDKNLFNVDGIGKLDLECGTELAGSFTMGNTREEMAIWEGFDQDTVLLEDGWG